MIHTIITIILYVALISTISLAIYFHKQADDLKTKAFSIAFDDFLEWRRENEVVLLLKQSDNYKDMKRTALKIFFFLLGIKIALYFLDNHISVQ